MENRALSLADKTNNFDLLRLFAAAQVMVIHVYLYLEIAPPSAVAVLGWFEGVPIFFVISGFLISASWKRSTSATDYAIKRAARIFPALWLCIALTVLAVTLLGFDLASGAGLAWIGLQAVGAIYTPGILREFGIGAYNTSLWTIPVELQFYVALPLLYLLAARLAGRRVFVLLAFAVFLIGAVVAYATWLPQLGQPETGLQKLVRYSFLPHFYLFLMGVAMREFELHRHPLVAGKALFWIALLVAYCWFVPSSPVAAIGQRLILGVCVLSVAYTLPTLAGRTLNGRDISYGIYIFHGLAINVAVQLGFKGQTPSMFAVMGATMLLATMSWIVVERPALRLAHARRSKAATWPQDAAATSDLALGPSSRGA